MKLDNRPKKLLVKGVDEGHTQALRDWYEVRVVPLSIPIRDCSCCYGCFQTTGQLDNVDLADNSSGAYIVSFKSRSAAEQGLAKGSNIPLIGSVQISWFTGKEGTSTSGGVATISPTTKTDSGPSADGVVGARKAGASSTQDMQEEEIVASGWGGDGDEGDGMGML